MIVRSASVTLSSARGMKSDSELSPYLAASQLGVFMGLAVLTCRMEQTWRHSLHRIRLR